ncbi:MAG: ABC transporter ATP-binding protein, partial [Oscillospiraceae bacterium]|nr:ABC transporter ATP-binding protein [Oscillospiraceae bacterium]
ALMVTHNLRYAVEYGDRLVMMHRGGVVKDVSCSEKDACSVDDLLKIFNEISIECGN